MSFGPAGPGPPRGAAPKRDTVSGPFSTLFFLPGSSQRRGPEEGPVSRPRVIQTLAPGPPVGRPDVWGR